MSVKSNIRFGCTRSCDLLAMRSNGVSHCRLRCPSMSVHVRALEWILYVTTKRKYASKRICAWSCTTDSESEETVQATMYHRFTDSPYAPARLSLVFSSDARVGAPDRRNHLARQFISMSSRFLVCRGSVLMAPFPERLPSIFGSVFSSFAPLPAVSTFSSCFSCRHWVE